MFGLGWSEILLIFVIGFFILEPNDLKMLSQRFAKFLRYTKWVSNKLILELDNWLEQAEQAEMQRLLHEKYPKVFLNGLYKSTELATESELSKAVNQVTPAVELVGDIADSYKASPK